jgi:hypothetical protein
MQQSSGALYEGELLRNGLPASVEAERTILGAILLDNHAYDEAEQITRSDFSLSSHQTIFGRIAAMIEDGSVVDLLTLAEDLRNRHEIDAIGGAAYLCSLTELLPRRLSIESYVQIVKEKSRRRALITLSALRQPQPLQFGEQGCTGSWGGTLARFCTKTTHACSHMRWFNIINHHHPHYALHAPPHHQTG